ncbi:MAG: DOMON domain-containing protein [Planctomycetota bacterium]|jgi:hypothetical protein
MTVLIPHRFLFSFEFPITFRNTLPALDGTKKGWTDACRLPCLGAVEDTEDFADWWAAWNESGIGFAVSVAGKKKPLQCDPERFWDGDNIRLMTDMRDARSNKRATRFCQQFYFLPTGGGKGDRAAVCGAAKVQRALADAPMPDPAEVRVAARVSKSGYFLEGRIGANGLSGFDPQEHSRIGFHLLVEDREMGQQYLTVGDELNWHIDPSTWATAVLAR